MAQGTIKEVGPEEQKKLDALAAVARPMQTVVMDGDKKVAYIVGRKSLDIADSVVSVTFSQLVILTGQFLLAIISPLVQGLPVVQRSGGNTGEGKHSS